MFKHFGSVGSSRAIRLDTDEKEKQELEDGGLSTDIFIDGDGSDFIYSIDIEDMKGKEQ